LEKKKTWDSEYKKKNNPNLLYYLMAKPPPCTHQFQPGVTFLFPAADREAPPPWG